MQISEFLRPADVIVGLREFDKTRLLTKLARRAAAKLKLVPDDVAQAVLAREQLGSTGMGSGVAIPHARISGIREPFGLLACIKKPIAFDAVDGAQVDVLFLLLLPEDPAPDHLHALASAARALRDPKVVRALRKARDSTDAYNCLT